jgi:hypothetical protein
MDVVEVMEIRDGLIAHHRVRGWYGVGMLLRDEHADSWRKFSDVRALGAA